MSEVTYEMLFSVFFGRSVKGEGNTLRGHIGKAFEATKKGGRVDVFKSRVLLC